MPSCRCHFTFSTVKVAPTGFTSSTEEFMLILKKRLEWKYNRELSAQFRQIQAQKNQFLFKKIFANRELLERDATVHYTQFKPSTSDERQKAKLIDVFVDWMLKRFSQLEKEALNSLFDRMRLG